jgi:hypothetical protein
MDRSKIVDPWAFYGAFLFQTWGSGALYGWVACSLVQKLTMSARPPGTPRNNQQG